MKILLASLLLVAAVRAEEPVDLVDPLIATATPRYDFFAAAATPFGMVALSPDTKHGELWNAGYRYDDQFILSFSHLHNIQLAGIPVMPSVGPSRGHLGLEANKATFSRDTEIAKPGYHRVHLTDRDITAELTASCRVGFHRYTFPQTNLATLDFDLSAKLGPCAMEDALARKISDTEIEGWSRMAPTYRRKKSCTVYFVAQFDRPVSAFGGWQKGDAGILPAEPNSGTISGPGSGFYVSFRDAKTVQMKVGLSFVSAAQARKNLAAEIPHWNFDAVVKAARDEWNAHLSRITVTGGPREQRVKHYTDLFHTAVGKRVFNDVDGSWPDYSPCSPVAAEFPAGKWEMEVQRLNSNAVVQTAGLHDPVIRHLSPNKTGQPSFRLLDMDCLWGGQWNLNLLWTLAYPDVANDVAETFLEYFRQDGAMPRGPWGGSDVFVMVGDPTTPLLAALVAQNRAKFDAKLAYATARKNAMPGGLRERSGYEAVAKPNGGGLADYIAHGYVPAETRDRTIGWHSGGTALTLEYAYQDWCLAELARRLGKTEDEALFRKRAQNFRNVFDKTSGWMRPRRDDGTWYEPFSPVGDRATAEHGFVEGNAAVYTWYVPHDLPGLIELVGGKDRFIARLDEQFQKASPHNFSMPHGEHANGWVEYGNEPAGAMAHLFAHAGAPHLTQKWVREVRLKTFGGTTPHNGYSGDEDQGMLAALSALMGIGLFDVRGGVGEHPAWQITAPLFDEVKIDLGNGTNLVIKAQNAAPTNPYIRSATFNGRRLAAPEIPATDLFKGGTLELELSAQEPAN